MPKVYKYILTLFILNTDKQVLWQKAASGSISEFYLFAKMKAIFRNVIITSKFGNFSVWPLLKHKMVYPICIVSLCLGKSIRMRRVVISVSEDLLLTLQTAQT